MLEEPQVLNRWQPQDYDTPGGISLLQTYQKARMRSNNTDAPSPCHPSGLPWSLVCLRPPGNPSSDLNTLDDFDECLRVVDYRSPEPQYIHSPPPSCIERVWELLTPWPVDLISKDFTEISQLMIPVAAAFLDASRPLTSSTMTHLSIYVDGSTHFFPEGDFLASYAILPVATVNDEAGATGYHILGHCGGILSTQPSDPFWTGADSPNSLDAERSGIILAIVWLLQSEYWHEVPVDILFDCTSAGYTASGVWSVDRTSLTAQVLRSFGQVIFELCGSRVTFQHVKGHSGDPGNELVDATAKAYAQLLINGSAEQIRINDLVHHIREDGSWLWTGIVRNLNRGDLPWFSADVIRLPEGQCAWNTLESFSFSSTGRLPDHQIPLVTFTIASLNIRGLFGRIQADHRHEYSATRGGYVAEQLLWSGYDIIGIQEAYTTDVGVGRFHGYWRIVGGADAKKKAGCELWIAEAMAIGSCNPQHFAVLLAEPRCHAVRITFAKTDNIFVVLHAPHNGVSKAEMQSWWTKHQKLTQTWQRMAPVFLLADANTQLSEPEEDRIGDLLSTKASNNAPYFIDLCIAADVWLPSTYSHHHQGGNATWRNPAGDWHCIDYVGIPSALQIYQAESWVDQYIDLDAHPEDHRPVGSRVTFTQHPLHASDYSFRRPNYDIRKLREPSFHTAVNLALEKYPPISWDTDVDSHAILLRDQIHDALAQCLPRQHKRCRQSYISDSTWSLRTAKKSIKANLSKLEEAHNFFWLRCSFRSLAGDKTMDAQIQPCLGALLHEEIRMATLRRTLRQITHDVRTSLQTDRDNYGIDVASRCNALPSQDVFKELRALRVGSVFKKKSKRALPNFLKPSGELTTSAQEVAEVWREHCASLEAGSPIDALSLLRESASTTWHRDLSNFDLKGVPTLMTLERHVRRMCPGKAAGVDGIPPDVGRFCPQMVSRLLFPLALKQGVLCREPLEYKGGLLAAMYKGKGSQNAPASHRGIMLTSVLGKAVRSSYREQCLKEYYEFTGDQYFSARPAANVGQAGMILRQYCKAVQDVGHSCVVVFLDIQSAYYSVCRELAHGFDGSDESIATLLSRFQLPPDHIHALGARLREGQGAMSSSSLSDFHKQMMVEMMHSTWYTVNGSPVLTRTFGGSRPGDGLAEMVFGYIFGELMHHLRRDLHTAGLISTYTWPNSFDIKDCLINGRPSVDLPDFLDIIWADDLALAISGPSAATVWSKAKSMATLLFDWCGRYGLRPNTQRGKTEALTYLRGPGSKQLKINIFNVAEPAIHLQSALFPQQKIAVVPQYRHLGGVLHISGKLYSLKWRRGLGRRGQRFVYMGAKPSAIRDSICHTVGDSYRVWSTVFYDGMLDLGTSWMLIHGKVLGRPSYSWGGEYVRHPRRNTTHGTGLTMRSSAPLAFSNLRLCYMFFGFPFSLRHFTQHRQCFGSYVAGSELGWNAFMKLLDGCTIRYRTRSLQLMSENSRRIGLSRSSPRAKSGVGGYFAHNYMQSDNINVGLRRSGGMATSTSCSQGSVANYQNYRSRWRKTNDPILIFVDRAKRCFAPRRHGRSMLSRSMDASTNYDDIWPAVSVMGVVPSTTPLEDCWHICGIPSTVPADTFRRRDLQKWSLDGTQGRRTLARSFLFPYYAITRTLRPMPRARSISLTASCRTTPWRPFWRNGLQNRSRLTTRTPRCMTSANWWSRRSCCQKACGQSSPNSEPEPGTLGSTATLDAWMRYCRTGQYNGSWVKMWQSLCPDFGWWTTKSPRRSTGPSMAWLGSGYDHHLRKVYTGIPLSRSSWCTSSAGYVAQGTFNLGWKLCGRQLPTWLQFCRSISFMINVTETSRTPTFRNAGWTSQWLVPLLRAGLDHPAVLGRSPGNVGWNWMTRDPGPWGARSALTVWAPSASKSLRRSTSATACYSSPVPCLPSHACFTVSAWLSTRRSLHGTCDGKRHASGGRACWRRCYSYLGRCWWKYSRATTGQPLRSPRFWQSPTVEIASRS